MCRCVACVSLCCATHVAGCVRRPLNYSGSREIFESNAHRAGCLFYALYVQRPRCMLRPGIQTSRRGVRAFCLWLGECAPMYACVCGLARPCVLFRSFPLVTRFRRDYAGPGTENRGQMAKSLRLNPPRRFLKPKRIFF